MAPHWKCGSRQRVEGSNPSLSAIPPADERPARLRAADGRVHVRARRGVRRPDRRRRRLRDPASAAASSCSTPASASATRSSTTTTRSAREPLPEVLAEAGITRGEITRDRELPPPPRPLGPEPAASRASRSTSSRPSGRRARARLHDPRRGSTSRARATEQVAGDHEVAPGHPDLRHARPLARPPVARRRHARRPAAPRRPGGLQPRRVERDRGRARGCEPRAGRRRLRAGRSRASRRSTRSASCSATTARAGRRRAEPGYPCAGRARRGTSGALYLQSAPAGLNSPSRPLRSEAAAPGGVEDRVPRSGESRTVSGPEGSSTQRSSSGAAERPDLSRLQRWARVAVGRRGVHGKASDTRARAHPRSRRSRRDRP